jgi:hypothetical protein
LDALKQAGCSKNFSDKMTGSRMDRPGWDQFMAYLRPGVRWRLFWNGLRNTVLNYWRIGTYAHAINIRTGFFL